MFTRTQTRQIKVKNLTIGGQNQCIIQSMTNTKTRDVEATVAQCQRLMKAGCQIIRVAITCVEDAQAIAEIKKQIDCPIVADIHFDYKLALACIEAGVDQPR